MSKIGAKPTTLPRDHERECSARVDTGNDNWVAGEMQTEAHKRTLEDGTRKSSDNGRSASFNAHVQCGDAFDRIGVRASAEMFIDSASQNYERPERITAPRNDEVTLSFSRTLARDTGSFRLHGGATLGFMQTGDHGLDHVQEGFHNFIGRGRVGERLTNNYGTSSTHGLVGASVGVSKSFDTGVGQLRLGLGLEGTTAIGYRSEGGATANMQLDLGSRVSIYGDVKAMYTTGDDIAGRDDGLNLSGALGADASLGKNFGLYGELRHNMNGQREALVGIRIGGKRRPDPFEPGFE